MNIKNLKVGLPLSKWSKFRDKKGSINIKKRAGIDSYSDNNKNHTTTTATAAKFMKLNDSF